MLILALTTLTLAVWGAWAGYLWHNRRLEPGPAPKEQMGPVQALPGGETVVDSTGPDDPLHQFLKIPATGFIFTQRTKYDALTDLQWLIEQHGIRGAHIRSRVSISPNCSGVAAPTA